MPRNKRWNEQHFRTQTTVNIPDETNSNNEVENRKKQFQYRGAETYLPSNLDSLNTSSDNSSMRNLQGNVEYLVHQNYTYQDSWQRRVRFSNTNYSTQNFSNYGNSYDFQHHQELSDTSNYRPQHATKSSLSSYQANSGYKDSHNTYNFKNWSEHERPINYDSVNHTQSSLHFYQAYSNYEFSDRPSRNYTFNQKRKREPEDEPSKRIKAIHRETNETFGQYGLLSENIMSYFRDNSQTDEIFSRKMTLRSRLQNIIQKHFSGCGVFVFGSSMTGFATKSSDVDMSLMFHDTKIVKYRVIGLLWKLRTLFSNYRNFKKLQVINAKVSILKFQDTLSGFDIDLNINNPTGIRNSQLLRSYARLDDRVRPLVLAVKFWAREHNINDAKSGTLSSYCLGLMLIHYLQCGCHPPVLPSLQALQPDRYALNSDVRSLELDEILPDFVSENCENVGSLFVGFLRYYSTQYNYEEKRISIRLGCLLPRVDKILNKEKTLRQWIDIEEPFEQTNTAGAVNNAKKAAYIKYVFDKSYNSVVQRGALGLI